MTRNATLFCIMVTVSLAAAARTAHAFPAGAALMNLSAAKNVSREPLPLSGTVAETMDAGGYTYIGLENKGKISWVAVPRMEVAVGRRMAFRPGAEMTNFTSKTLNRSFERIVFSQGPAEGQSSASQGAPKEAHAKSAAGGNGNAKVEKATGPNAHTVAELYNGKNTLDKKKVAVRGKVVKVAVGIMGKNWVHLRDGSGSAKKKTNDLTVTTRKVPNEGDIVTAVGILHKDRDFGSGYKYELIIEDADLQP
jgi:hypothetical protein